MKRMLKFGTGVYMTILAISCAKSKGSPSAPLDLAGKWNIVADSSYAGVGYLNHLVIYVGTPGDYFDFSTDGKLYTKEGLKLDTLSYTAVSDSTLFITSFGIITNGIPDTCTISHLSATSVSISSIFYATPGGLFGRKVELSRDPMF